MKKKCCNTSSNSKDHKTPTLAFQKQMLVSEAYTSHALTLSLPFTHTPARIHVCTHTHTHTHSHRHTHTHTDTHTHTHTPTHTPECMSVFQRSRSIALTDRTPTRLTPLPPHPRPPHTPPRAHTPPPTPPHTRWRFCRSQRACVLRYLGPPPPPHT